MSKWDWIHAGLEIATYAKAQEAQQKMQAVQTYLEKEAAKRIFIEALRNFIFDIARDIQLAEGNIEELPQQVYIVAAVLNKRLAVSEFAPEMFTELSDKQYAFDTQQRIQAVLVKCKERLTGEEMEKADQVVDYIYELPILQAAIRSASVLPALQATAERWQKLEKQRPTYQIGIVIGGALSIGMMMAGVYFYFLFYYATWVYGALGLVGGGILLAITIVLAVSGAKTYIFEYSRLKTEREQLINQLAPTAIRKQIVGNFGNLSAAEYQKLYEERSAVIAAVLGKESQKYLQEGV